MISVPTTRFAPSPTGLLHLGHAHAALFAEEQARRFHGRFLVRMEDIDTQRCRREFEGAIFQDLHWLKLKWEEPVRRQTDHLADYEEALARLKAMGLLYPCFCSRKDISAELAEMPHAPHGLVPVYPGRCRRLSEEERRQRMRRGDAFSLRLHTVKALEQTGPLTWRDEGRGTIPARPNLLGDVVLARKNSPMSYHLAVTVDDHIQGITLVTRGEDLFDSTHIHRLLQALLGLHVPRYHHHGLLTCSEGRRLSKRDKSLSIRALREAGKTPEEVRAMAGF